MKKPSITFLFKVIAGYLLACLLFWLLSLLAGCNTIALELGAGYDTHLEQGSNPRSVIRMRGELDGCFNTKGTCVAEFNHHSSYRDGWPVNDRAESLTNQWSVIYRYPIWQAK